MPIGSSEEKPKRLYFKSYLRVIRNSVGSNMFRNFYVTTPERGEFDAFDDGENSCAFFVSAILVIFQKLSGFHGIVRSTVQDLKTSGWQEVEKPEPGDVLVWEARQFDDGLKEHIGFYIGEGRAVSTSWTKRTPIEHDLYFGEDNRKITIVLRMENWDNDPQAS
jgi:hypothetical protein